MGEQMRVQRKTGTTAPQLAPPAALSSDLTPSLANSTSVLGQDFGLITIVPQTARQGDADPERADATQPAEAPLLLSQPGDPSEREASAVATRVLQPGAPLTTGQIVTQARPGELGRQSTGGAATSEARRPAIDVVLASEGQPLDQATRTYMEPRFGHSFADVRIHTDGRAAESAQAIDAYAYTSGRDIVFGAGRYAPDTGPGQQLLAHELTHVVQQRGVGVYAASTIVQRDGGATAASTAPAQPVPFVPPDGSIQVDPEGLLYDVVRARVGDLINLSYTAYETAISRVQAEMLANYSLHNSCV